MGRAPPLMLAIDLGTSNCKVALVSSRGRIVASASHGVDILPVAGGGVEQEPRQIWRTVLATATRVLRESGAARRRVLGVAVTSQFSSIVPVDQRGSPLMNMILWMDRRGGPMVQRIYRRHADALATWIELHGRRPSPAGGQSLAHILYVRSERPDIYGAARAFLEPMDYLAMQLTGACSASLCTAFSSLLTDNLARSSPRYHPRLLAMANIDRDKLPPLLPVNSRIGTLRRQVAAKLGLPATTTVFSGSNDTQAASVAVGAFRPERGGINVGSTAQILARAADKKTDLDRDLLTMPSPIRADWLVLAENGLAGKCLDLFLRRVVFAHDGFADHSTTRPFDRIERALRATPAGSDGLLFLPWLTGSESPAPNDRVRGAFINISVNTNRELMVRAILEGIAFSLRWLREAVESFRAAALSDLRFCGGGARSDGWAQILADVMGRSVHQLDNAGYAGCRAAAFLAFEQLSLVDLGSHEEFFPVRKRFAPCVRQRETYDRQYEHFLHGLRINLPVFDALNR